MSQLGGGVGVADHITIGKCVQIAARSGVMNDIPMVKNGEGAQHDHLNNGFVK